MYLAQTWDWIFPLGDNADYEPDRSMSILARAQARGVPPIEEAYDRLLDDDGHAILLGAMANFENNSLGHRRPSSSAATTSCSASVTAAPTTE